MKMTRRLAGVLATALGVAAWSVACADLPSDPKTPFALELGRPGSPSVVLGDTLRDSLGMVAPLRGAAFNADGDTIAGAAVSFHIVAVIDSTAAGKRDSTPARIDAATGTLVVARPERVFAGKTFRLYAQAGGLQTAPVTLTVTRRPDTLIAADTAITRLLTFLGKDSVQQVPFVVRLRHTPDAGIGELPGDTTVPAYLVRYAILAADGQTVVTDTTYVMLGTDGKLSPWDTTDGSGVATRSLRLRRGGFPLDKPHAPGSDTIVDSLHVRASAVRPGGSPVPGSPHDFLLLVKLRVDTLAAVRVWRR